jgi:hypothetical protein
MVDQKLLRVLINGRGGRYPVNTMITELLRASITKR